MSVIATTVVPAAWAAVAAASTSRIGRHRLTTTGTSSAPSVVIAAARWGPPRPSTEIG
ncbi:hypothetical protein BFL35_07000 [Clavibacter michiganensis]|nr:hypothetical protein BFL35_07000 [Clavibacter michiganensis]